MNGATHRERLDELTAMQQTGVQTHPDQKRAVGALLAERLPKLIAAAADRAGRVAAAGRRGR